MRWNRGWCNSHIRQYCLRFSGNNNFINNYAETEGGAIYTLYLALVEPTTLSTIQPELVVQFSLTTLYLASMEPVTLSITQHLLVELSQDIQTTH